MNTNTQPKARFADTPHVSPSNTQSERLEHLAEKQLGDQQHNPVITPEDTYSEILAKEHQNFQPKYELSVNRSGKELGIDEFIMPRRISQTYTEQNGKFYSKDKNIVMFEDKGQKLATSTTDKTTIADMIVLAKAKQWDNLKLTGSNDFRREAWLQAESQGIKTQGYTPKEADLAALETLRQERATNTITPQPQQYKSSQKSIDFATNEVNKNQAEIHTNAESAITSNIETLRAMPNMKHRSVEEISQLAYWRGVVAENTKLQPEPQKLDALARFDKQANDPQFLKRLNQATKAEIDDKTIDRVQERKTYEHTL